MDFSPSPRAAVPDDAARAAYHLKWADRPAYDRMMREQAAKLEGKG